MASIEGLALDGRAGRALRLSLGAASPLWVAFGAAVSAGVAYWWMTRWTRPKNVEALAALDAASEAPPAEIAAEPHLEAPAPAAELEAPEPAQEPVAIIETAAPIAVLLEAGPIEAPADDLTQIVGIGPKLSEALAAHGVIRFAQIAAWKPGDLAEVDEALGLRGRAVRDAWVAQAKRFVASV